MCATESFHTVAVPLMQMEKTIKDQRTTALAKQLMLINDTEYVLRFAQ